MSIKLFTIAFRNIRVLAKEIIESNLNFGHIGLSFCQNMNFQNYLFKELFQEKNESFKWLILEDGLILLQLGKYTD